MITEAMNFPAYSEQEMDAFVGWLYSGRLDRQPNQRLPCLLWTFGRKFEAPLFQNDAMRLLSDNIRLGALRVPTVNFAYNTTAADPFLRLFIAECFTHANPLATGRTESWIGERQRAYKIEWVNLIAKGGDFMKDVALLGLHNDNKEQDPWRAANFRKFFETKPDRSPASWKMGRILETLEPQGANEKQQHVGDQRGVKRTNISMEEQPTAKKQKKTNEGTPATKQEVKDQIAVRQSVQTPSRRKDQTPMRQNAQTPTRLNIQNPIRCANQAQLREDDQPSARQNNQTPIRWSQAPYQSPNCCRGRHGY